jgi:hypothetical protein
VNAQLICRQDFAGERGHYMTNTDDWDFIRCYMAVGDAEYGYLKMEDLKDGWSYQICARNAHIGIWIASLKGFLISRHKFELNYLFVEYHWDTGPPHGTVKPFFEIENAPFGSGDLSDELEMPRYLEILDYLNHLSERFLFNDLILAISYRQSQ